METLIFLLLVIAFIAFRLVFFGSGDKLARERSQQAEGFALLKSKEYEKAARWFARVLAQNPNSGLAHAGRGRSLLALGMPYEALNELTRALSLENHLPEAYLDKGKALMLLEEYKEALVELDKAVWYAPHSAEAYRTRGLAFLKTGSEERARNDFNAAVQLGDEDAHQQIKQLTLNRKRF